MVKPARIQPFKGLCYNPAKIAYEDVIAPPYDVISDRQKKALAARSPYNIVRLILGARDESPERYETVKTLLNNWIHEGVLRFDTQPAVYFYMQDYDLENGSRLTRKGFIALCKLESFASGKIAPHEMTHKKQIDDRLMLLRASQANLSPIFSLYSDPEMTINETFMEKHQDDPLLDTTDEDNVRHRFYRVTDPEALALAVQVLSEKKLLIADGHHRYATALAYRNEMRKLTGNSSGQAPFDYVMMYFTNTHDKGLTILPSHRLLHSLENFEMPLFLEKLREFFDVTEFPFQNEEEEQKQRVKFFDALKVIQGREIGFGLFLMKRSCFCLLTLKQKMRKDTILLSFSRSIRHMAIPIFNELVLKRILNLDTDQKRQTHINIIKNNGKAIDLVHSGRFQMAFLFNPNTFKEIHDVIADNQVMPPKSTFFFPKLLSGLVIYKHAPRG